MKNKMIILTLTLILTLSLFATQCFANQSTQLTDKQYLEEYRITVNNLAEKVRLFQDIAKRGLGYNVSTEYMMLNRDIDNLQQNFDKIECPDKYKNGKQYLDNAFNNFRQFLYYYQLASKSHGYLFEEYMKYVKKYRISLNSDTSDMIKFLKDNGYKIN